MRQWLWAHSSRLAIVAPQSSTLTIVDGEPGVVKYGGLPGGLWAPVCIDNRHYAVQWGGGFKGKDGACARGGHGFTHDEHFCLHCGQAVQDVLERWVPRSCVGVDITVGKGRWFVE